MTLQAPVQRPEAGRSAHDPCRIAPLRIRGAAGVTRRRVVGFRNGGASSTGSPTVSKQSGAGSRLTEAMDEPVELGVRVELDLDAAAARARRDPDARSE